MKFCYCKNSIPINYIELNQNSTPRSGNKQKIFWLRKLKNSIRIGIHRFPVWNIWRANNAGSNVLQIVRRKKSQENNFWLFAMYLTLHIVNDMLQFYCMENRNFTIFLWVGNGRTNLWCIDFWFFFFFGFFHFYFLIWNLIPPPCAVLLRVKSLINLLHTSNKSQNILKVSFSFILDLNIFEQIFFFL